MPLERLLFGGSLPVILGSAQTALWGLNPVKGKCHNFCTVVCKDVTYKELKNLLNSKRIMLIDVRETSEILEHGKIPGSVNIPLGEVGEALQMNPEDFKEKYNNVKPSKSEHLVFSCFAGMRSRKALDTAISLGFNRKNKDVHYTWAALIPCTIYSAHQECALYTRAHTWQNMGTTGEYYFYSVNAKFLCCSLQESRTLRSAFKSLKLPT